MINHTSLLSEAELRLQLRGLAKERELERDLWSNIKANIESTANQKNRWAWSGFVMAASLALIAVMAMSFYTSKQSDDVNAIEAQVLAREVKAMDAEYDAALKEFASVRIAPEVQAEITLLDDSAKQLRQALNKSPQSTYLIPMLRRTYLQRLQLSQRASASNFT